ncbi:MAG: hypothetical protein ABI462_07010 [Ignavibacteria bacterium]
MKKISFIIFALLLVGKCYSQSGEWASVLYSYSKGPVSPEYQYNYTVWIDETGSGKLTYTKSASTNTYEFTVSKEGLDKLNNALMKSQVFVISEDSLKGERTHIGGPEKSLLINRLQYAVQGSIPATIEIPIPVNEKYSDSINELYETIDGLVPSDVWDLARAQ